MAGNTTGKIFKLSTFGESHGIGIGGIVDGCPAGLEIDINFIQQELNRRKPGQSKLVSPRKESDQVEFLSGIYQGVSTGTPIGFIIRNADQKPSDYDHLKDAYRPSHADFTYEKKYGFRDHRGSGRASARETVSRVVGGAIAKLILNKFGIKVYAYVSQIGQITMQQSHQEINLDHIENSPVRCPDPTVSEKMKEEILEAQKQGDSLGGIITGIARGVPAGLGEPVFDKLNADLAKAMLSINAVKGFEIGSGFASCSMKGSEHNDIFVSDDKQQIKTLSNNSGGIQGGISNGEDIYFRIAFKPVSTILKNQQTIDKQGNTITIEGKGRHDACVLPRAVPIVEAMTALVLVDHLLRNRSSVL